MGPPPGEATNDEALAAAFQARYLPMVRLATWLLGDGAAAEDLVQDAFVRLARRDLVGLESVDAYLRTTVVNLCRSRRRRQRLERRHRLTPLGPGSEPEASPADEELARAVAALPRRQRECVVLRFTEDLAVADIATALGISPGSVKTHLHRGLATLGAALAPALVPGPARLPAPGQAPAALSDRRARGGGHDRA